MIRPSIVLEFGPPEREVKMTDTLLAPTQFYEAAVQREMNCMAALCAFVPITDCN